MSDAIINDKPLKIIPKSIKQYLLLRHAGTPTETYQFKFSQASLEKLPVADDDYVVRDTQHSGLRCLIRKSGKKVIQLCKKPKGKKSVVKVSICDLGELPYSQIDSIINEKNSILLQGMNPNSVKKAEIAKDESDNITLQQALDLKLKNGSQKASSSNSYKSNITVNLSDWLNTPLNEITATMVINRYRELLEDKPDVARGAFVSFRTIYNFIADELSDDVTGESPLNRNPTWKIGKLYKSWHVSNRRTRLLKPTELKTYWNALSSLPADQAEYIQFLIVTGFRKNEARQLLEWSGVDFEAKTISITDTKNGSTHTIPMNSISEGILRRRYEATEGKTRPFNVPETQRTFAAMTKKTGIELSCHDLRRTCANYATLTGVDSAVVKRMLNHVENLTEKYINIDVELMREPYQKLADFINEKLK